MSTALVREHEMVTKARGLLVQYAEADVAIGRARTLAGTVKGLVVTSAADAAGVVDTAVAIGAGIKALDAQRKAVNEIPRAVEKAVNDYANGILVELRAAKQACDDANNGWLRREAERKARELEAERAQAVLDAAQETAETGEEAVPFDFPAEAEAPKMVRGSSGSQGTVRVLACEWDAPPHPWAILNEAAAKAWFRAEVKAGRLLDPGPNQRVRAGAGVFVVVFWYNISIATRRA